MTINDRKRSRQSHRLTGKDVVTENQACKQIQQVVRKYGVGLKNRDRQKSQGEGDHEN